jgi:hypothetical protein
MSPILFHYSTVSHKNQFSELVLFPLGLIKKKIQQFISMISRRN